MRGGGGGLFGHQFRQNFRKIDSSGGLLQSFLEKLNINEFFDLLENQGNTKGNII